MHMHFAPTERRMRLRDPMCGYVAPNDEICTDPKLCTCPECLDWIGTPEQDQAPSNTLNGEAGK